MPVKADDNSYFSEFCFKNFESIIGRSIVVLLKEFISLSNMYHFLDAGNITVFVDQNACVVWLSIFQKIDIRDSHDMVFSACVTESSDNI